LENVTFLYFKGKGSDGGKMVTKKNKEADDRIEEVAGVRPIENDPDRDQRYNGTKIEFFTAVPPRTKNKKDQSE
jgi:hypothetical protein